jgi:hypothetical protein
MGSTFLPSLKEREIKGMRIINELKDMWLIFPESRAIRYQALEFVPDIFVSTSYWGSKWIR